MVFIELHQLLDGLPGSWERKFSLPWLTANGRFHAFFFSYVLNLGGFSPSPTREVAMLKREFRFWPAVVVIALLGSLGACTWFPGLFPSRIVVETHRVEVLRTGDEISFSLDPVIAHPLDFIEWSHDFSETVIVELQGVPVTPGRQVIPESVTGMVMVWDTASDGHYKYVVKVVRAVGDTIVVDPHIDVRPKRGG